MKRQFHTAVDYVSHYEADKEILVIAERRWDMYHMLSATQIALCVGLFFGILFRLLYGFFPYGNPFAPFPPTIAAWFETVISLTELVTLIAILAFSIILVAMLYKQKNGF